MAVHQDPDKNGIYTADEDLSSDLYRGVELKGDKVVGKPASKGNVPVGVLHNEPKSGEAAELAVDGVTKAEAGEALSGGGAVTVDSDGQFVAATSNDYIYGRATEPVAAAGIVFSLQITKEDKS